VPSTGAVFAQLSLSSNVLGFCHRLRSASTTAIVDRPSLITRRTTSPSPVALWSFACAKLSRRMSLRRKGWSTCVGLSLRSAESRSEPSRGQERACALPSASSTVQPKRYALRLPGSPCYPRKARLLDTSRREDPGAGAWSNKPDASAFFGFSRHVRRTVDALTSSALSRIPPRNAAVRSDVPFVEPSIRASPRREMRLVGPRCLPPVSPVSRSTYPQPVPSLWIKRLRPWDSRS